MTQRHLIQLGGPSNERLVGATPIPPRSPTEIRADLRAAVKAGARRILFTGGEPTLRRDLLALVRTARSLDLGVGLATNGRMLLYPKLRRALLSAGVDHLRISLHAATASVHDAMVAVPGAFTQALAAMRALLADVHDVEIEVVCTVTPENQGQLDALAELLDTLPGTTRPRLVEVTPGSQQPNSFNFEHREDLPGFILRAGGCTARDMDLPQANRHLLLEQGGQVSHYSTPTRDFTDSEVRRVKEETEQLYLDVSGAAALGDLARHVHRVRAHAECLACPHRPGCCGAFSPSPGDPFLAEEAWLRQRLEDLAGEVLEVGCGEQPYSQLMGEKIRAGQMTYLGLDPDSEALDRLRERGFPGQLRVGQIETLRCQEGSMDHVLALRTVNHVEDLPRALEVMTRALRPGGELLLSDMTVYGLLRTPGQVALADADGHHQEHHRNLDAEGVLGLLGHLPLELIERRPVTRETSNEWFLRLRRQGDAG